MADNIVYDTNNLTNANKTLYYIGSYYMDETQLFNENNYKPLGFLRGMQAAGNRTVEEFGEIGSKYRFISQNDAQLSLRYDFNIIKMTSLSYLYHLLNEQDSQHYEEIPSPMMIDFDWAGTSKPFNILEVKKNIEDEIISKKVYIGCLHINYSVQFVAGTSKSSDTGVIMAAKVKTQSG